MAILDDRKANAFANKIMLLASKKIGDEKMMLLSNGGLMRWAIEKDQLAGKYKFTVFISGVSTQVSLPEDFFTNTEVAVQAADTIAAWVLMFEESMTERARSMM